MASSEHILTLTRKTLDEFETVGLSASEGVPSSVELRRRPVVDQAALTSSS